MTETPPGERSGRGDGGEHGVALALAERETPGTEIEPVALDVAPESAAAEAPDAPAESGVGRPWWLLVAGLLAAVPLARMARWVLSGTETQYADYWLMIDETLLPSGGLRLGHLLEFSNDHPVVIPKIIYWLNLHNTGGSNIALGLVVVAVVAAQVALVAVVVRRSSWPWPAKVAVVVAASSLLFTPLGAWNFLKSMSGTAWLTANAFALAAVVTRWRGRVWVACALGLLACLSYGTGLAVWPALVVAGLLVDRRVLTQWPTVLVATGVAGGYLLARSSGDERPDVAGMRTLGRYFLEVVSGPLVPFDFEQSAWVGAVVVTAVALTAVAALVFGDWREVAPWLALSVFGLMASALVALGRADLIISFGSNRHASLGALSIIGAVGMLGAIATGGGARSIRNGVAQVAPATLFVIATVAVVAAGVFADHSEVDRVRQVYATQDRLAIALTFGLAGGTAEPLGGLGEMPADIEALLQATDHLPYGEAGLDCGLAGQAIDLDAVAEDAPEGVDARLVDPVRTLERTEIGRGWIRDDEDLVRCIVVVDGNGDVVGAGAMGPQGQGYGPTRRLPPGTDGFVTVQPIDTSDASYVLVLRDGTYAAVTDSEDAIRF